MTVRLEILIHSSSNLTTMTAEVNGDNNALSFMAWDVESFPALISMRASCIAEDSSCRARMYSTSCSKWQRLLLRKHAWSTVNADECSDWPALSATDGCDWPSLSLAVNVADIADSDWIRRDSARSRTHWTRFRTNCSLHSVESLASAYTVHRRTDMLYADPFAFS